jgi:hypothetical protein
MFIHPQGGSKTLTLDDMASVEYRSLVKAGADPSLAAGIVREGMADLQSRGVTPMFIPWGGK